MLGQQTGRLLLLTSVDQFGIGLDDFVTRRLTAGNTYAYTLMGLFQQLDGIVGGLCLRLSQHHLVGLELDLGHECIARCSNLVHGCSLPGLRRLDTSSAHGRHLYGNRDPHGLHIAGRGRCQTRLVVAATPLQLGVGQRASADHGGLSREARLLH